MEYKQNNRLIILAGPSCVGKSPLSRALATFHPELSETMQPLLLYNSRQARPGEKDGVDYHFRSRKQIEILKDKDQFVVMEVRGDLQALDLQELLQSLKENNVFFEGNPFIGRALQTHTALTDVKRLSIFMSPLSHNEILFLKKEKNVSLPDLITDVMRRKLLRRTRKQKGDLSVKDLENIERRAASAYEELKEAHHFQYVIPNHDGEDSENWYAFYYPLGDARTALNTFIALLEDKNPSTAEIWDKSFIP